jgi:DoxX-like protein
MSILEDLTRRGSEGGILQPNPWEGKPMPTADQTAPISKGALWTGRVLSGLVILFLIFDITLKLIPAEIALTTSAELGYPSTAAFARSLGIVLLVCTALYAYPKTSILGAILLTGYLGGAIATHVRVGSPLFSHVLFGVYLGLMLWGGLYLRDLRLRALIPFQQ